MSVARVAHFETGLHAGVLAAEVRGGAVFRSSHGPTRQSDLGQHGRRLEHAAPGGGKGSRLVGGQTKRRLKGEGRKEGM